MNLLLKAVGHLLSCKEASRYVSRSQDARLSAFARWTLEMHLKVCAHCTRFEQQLRVMRETLRRYKR